MRTELIFKGAALSGNSDLTLLAPIRPGFVPSLDAVTYKTRVKRLLRALHTGRSSTHEYALHRPFSDAVERVGKIHSVRVAVLEGDDKLLLSVSFEGPWEAYVRVLWQKVGRLLDVIFCNTEGYVTSWEHSFDEWAQWARSVQIETQFFYAMPALTVDDVHWLRAEEGLRRSQADGVQTDLRQTRMAVSSAEMRAWQAVDEGGQGVLPEIVKQGLQSLAGLYRLTDLYLPGSDDGRVLHGATCELLSEFMARRGDIDSTLSDPRLRGRFARQIDWLFQTPSGNDVPADFRQPALPTATPQPEPVDDVQGGILQAFEGLGVGCLVLLAFADRAALVDFLDPGHLRVTRNGQEASVGVACNLAFTVEGLRSAGIGEAELAAFPEEFRQGMEARASVLGDVRGNHPRRWRLPPANWGDAGPVDAGQVTVPWASVHAVVQLRTRTASAQQDEVIDIGDARHPLRGEIDRLFGRRPGVRVLSVQPMQRTGSEGLLREHFGFADGKGQPTLDPAEKDSYRSNQIALGELLQGYDNQADHALDRQADDGAKAWLHNGSFLVLRKLRQDVQALEDALDAAVTRQADLFRQLGLNDADARDLIAAKMMGRWKDGTPLLRDKPTNDFTYINDADGSKCPFHAHIRRANPRPQPDPNLPEPPGRRTPRIMRRGMSYGPRWIKANGRADRAERGLVFMAYNASIGEQFEVIQRWISGGNSGGGFSGQSDPFLGIAEPGKARHFRFEHAGHVIRVALDAPGNGDEPADTLVRLEWGAYLFTPSLTAIDKLRYLAQSRALELPWSVTQGAREIARLQALELGACPGAARLAWKAALEDSESQQRFLSASIWAAIRELHGGVLRTAYGVLVADAAVLDRVLLDHEGHYSVSGYRERMQDSIGENYLGLDDEPGAGAYAEQSRAANAAIMALAPTQAFDLAYRSARDKIDSLLRDAQSLAGDNLETSWELTLELREIIDEVLVALCEWWFGLTPEGGHFQPGPLRWDWQPGDAPFYPGHFTAPSRYIFQPHPGPSVVALGQTYGQAVCSAALAFVTDWRAQGRRPRAPDGSVASVGEAIFGPVDVPTSDSLAARALVGGLMGFLPTLDGSLRRVFNEWLRDGTFWSLRTQHALRPLDSLAAARSGLAAPMHAAMQLRPMPEMVWRVATVTHRLGRVAAEAVTVEAGDTVVLALVSATQQALAAGDEQVLPIFGGDRRPADHPTHACPGYAAALAVMLGVSAALVSRREALRPGPAPLSLTFEGRMADEAGLPPWALRRSDWLVASTDALRSLGVGIAESMAATASGSLLMFGDSWFHYPLGGVNLAKALKARGYTGPRPVGNFGLWLKDMASGRFLTEFLDRLKAMLDEPNGRPRAILLSGGGNDAVKEQLLSLVNKKTGEGLPLLNEEALEQFVEGTLREHFLAILRAIRATETAVAAPPVPVLIHGYDHPIADGRYIPGKADDPRAWLRPFMQRQGYDQTAGDNADGTQAMRLLISRLNEMLAALPTAPGVGPVFHVQLCGALASKFANHTDAWANELHPMPVGFALLAEILHDKITRWT